MKKSTLDNLLQEIKKFNTERDWDQYHTPKNLAMALMVEAGELMEHFQWLTPEQSRAIPPEKLENIEEEIGDVLIYLINISDKLGINPIAAVETKIEKNKKKYPISKSRGRALKYNEFK